MTVRPLAVFGKETRVTALFLLLHFWGACCQDRSLLPTTTDHELNTVSENNRNTPAGTSSVSARTTDELHIVSVQSTTTSTHGLWDGTTLLFVMETQPPFYFPMTPDDAMKAPRTEEFLRGIPDLEIRTLSEKYLRLCPKVPLCSFSLDYLQYHAGQVPCCSPCNCTASCKVGEDCCPHLLSELGPLVQAAEDRDRCIDPVVLRRDSARDIGQGYFMKTTCSESTGDPRLAYKCSAPYDERTEPFKLSDVVPVTDRASNTTYRNIHCARCAGLQPDSVSFWQPEIHCSGGPLLLSPEASIMAAIRAREDCYLQNIPGADIQAHLSYCEPSYVETCNETGLWQQYDQFTERACAGFKTVYTIKTMDKYAVYRNVFCAICNGETLEDVCFEGGFDSGRKLVPFSALLQFSLQDDISGESPLAFDEIADSDKDGNTVDCQIDFLFDSHKNVCRPLICPPFRRLQNDSCVDQYMTLEGISYEVFLKLVPKISMPTEVALDAINAIKTDIDISQCNVPDVYIKVDYPFQGDTFTTLVDIRRYNSSISHFIARLFFQQGPYGVENVEEYVKENLTGSSWLIEVHEKVYELDVEVLWSDSWLLPDPSSPPGHIPLLVFFDPNNLWPPFPPGTPSFTATFPPPTGYLTSFHHSADTPATESTPRSTTHYSSSDTSNSIDLHTNGAATDTTPSDPPYWQDTPPTPGQWHSSPWDSIVSTVDPHDDRVVLTLASLYPLFGYDFRCPFKDNPVRLSEQLDCPMVKLTLVDYNFDWVPDGVFIPDVNISLSFKHFYSHDPFAIFVCADKVFPTYKPRKYQKAIPIKPTSGHVFAETIVSLICTCCSILCLMVTLTIYCMFPTLRTVPGRNNMMLMATLILAQTLYIVMSVGGIRVDWLCETVGLLLHFFWLSAIFWMGICSFHMFRVFIQIAQHGTEDDKCTFCVYIAAVNIAAMLLVVSNIVTAQVITDGRRIGYGGLLCYISSGKMILFTFGIPVAVVIVTNLVMFVLVVVKIKSMPNIQKNVKRERNTAIIFAKLSTLTGVTWIFGFLAQWTGIVAFTYIFTILNASQGVFLMVSFVCNKRILHMVRKRYGRQPGTSATSFSTRSTTATMVTKL